ncbi:MULTISPECIES: Ig-like domain-containing protein [unclassified Streptosporangium]|uniref:Ig-like domain-containing protein n=1 Tax=unclassified Streptosporangium TaxID=2632669 RepID=UPI002E27D23E|nr:MULTISPECIES: Ig-like domain-containing protein [unclassified Streptosporangium]
MVRSGLAGILATLAATGVAAVPGTASAASVSPGGAANLAVPVQDSGVGVGATVITGSAGESPGTSFSGFPPTAITGAGGRGDTVAQPARRAAPAARDDADPAPGTNPAPGTDPAVSSALLPCGTATTVTGLASTCGSGSDSGPITFTATVTASDGSVPTGVVVFATDGATLGRAQLVAGVATLTMSSLSRGVYRVIGYYSGTDQYDPSNTPLLVQRVDMGCPCTPGRQTGLIRVRVNGETRSPAPGGRVRTQTVFGRSA